MNFDEIYDVVIVGAGVTGSIVASKMAENGKRVLILEAGSGKGLKQGGFNSFLDRFFTADIKSPIAPFPHSDNAPVDFGIGNYYVQEGPQNFGSNNTRVAGGTTLHWMGTSLRYLPNDFNLKSTYGHGIDWPFNYEDLEPYYQQAEWELGVAANVEDQEQLDPDRKLFGEVALEKGYVDSAQLYEALTEQVRRKAEGKSEKQLGQILLELGFETAEQVREILDVVYPVTED